MGQQFASIVKAMLHYFGMTAGELVAEWKALTDDDKRDFAQMLVGEGYEFPIGDKGF